MTKKKMPKVTLYYDEKPKEVYLEKQIIKGRNNGFAWFIIIMCSFFYALCFLFYGLAGLQMTPFCYKMFLFGNGYCIASFLFALILLCDNKVYYKQISKEDFQKC
jgi:hypothetical protein